MCGGRAVLTALTLTGCQTRRNRVSRGRAAVVRSWWCRSLAVDYGGGRVLEMAVAGRGLAVFCGGRPSKVGYGVPKGMPHV